MSQTLCLATGLDGPSLRPLHPLLGAELAGLDVASPLPPDALALLRRALRAHLVVVLPDQDATPEAQLRFTRQLGGLQAHPVAALALSDSPEIVLEEPARDVQDLLWHADLAWVSQPNRYSVLASSSSPDGGSVTEFCSQIAAYDRLDPWLKHRIEYLDAEHDHPRRQALGLPVSRHPLVRVDRETGQRSLMPGGATARRIPGLPPAESDDLLHRLRCAATHPVVVFAHRWRPGDVVVWDNLAVLHRHATAGAQRLHRTMVRGAPPLGPVALTNAWVSAG